MFYIVFLVWSASFDTCIARRGKHWRQRRSNPGSLAKKKGKSHGNSHHQHHTGVPKPKAPPHKAPALPPPVPKEKAPKPKAPPHKAPAFPPPAPKEKAPKPSPPQKGSTTFNVLDFGAKGNGKSDDTKVLSCLLHTIKLVQNKFQFYLVLYIYKNKRFRWLTRS